MVKNVFYDARIIHIFLLNIRSNILYNPEGFFVEFTFLAFHVNEVIISETHQQYQNSSDADDPVFILGCIIESHSRVVKAVIYN